MRRLLLIVLVPFLAAPKSADEARVVEVRVVDEDGAPIPSAVVRHPEEVHHHRGSAVPPYWAAQVLYLMDGQELVFVPGLELVLEVSAPGYANHTITHTVKRRKRKNELTVELEVLRLEVEAEGEVIQFHRK